MRTSLAVAQGNSRQSELYQQLTGFWASDTWDMAQCPLLKSSLKVRFIIRFSGISQDLQREIKIVCWYKYTQGIWSVNARSHARYIHLVVKWLQHTNPDDTSFLERPLQWWETSFRSYYTEKGILRDKVRYELNKQQQLRKYTQEDSMVSVVRQIYSTLQEIYDVRHEFEKDVWDLRKLNIPIDTSKSEYKLAFTDFSQHWLREALKLYMKYNITINSQSNCSAKLRSLKRFALFLAQHYPDLHPADLNRRVIVDYLSYLHTCNFRPGTRRQTIVHLRLFLEACVREGWAPVPNQHLVYDDDMPREERHRHPRYIPESVLEQLNKQLHLLPPPIMRMVLILQECGMRIGELCRMPFDCLQQDKDGDWWLVYFQFKMNKEHRIPIFPEVVAVIQEQQEYVRSTVNTLAPKYLFPGQKDGSIRQERFSDALNKLAYEQKILDPDGTIFRFRAHGFRHTVGTRMINRGYPQHIVQRYLGHDSPTMTSVYAHLHDETLKKEFQKFAEDQVDIQGRKGTMDSVSFDAIDPQWFKKNLHAQALPNGTCWLPATKGRCPHANACLTCPHFRTDMRFLPQHKVQLDETRRLLEKARTNGWERQVEMNEQVERNLERIIITLQQVQR